MVSPQAPPRPMLPCSLPSRVPVVTEEVAREALLSFVNSHCCYSSAAAGNLIIQELRQQTLCRVGRPYPEVKDTGRGSVCPGGVCKQYLLQPSFSVCIISST